MGNYDNDNGRNLGSLFKGIDKFMNIIGDMIDNEKDEMEIRGPLNGQDKKSKIAGSYGINIRFATGKSQNNENIKTFASKEKFYGASNAVNIIEPVADIFDEEDKITIVMELVGISEESIKIEIDGDLIRFSAQGEGNNYTKNLKLKFKPEASNVKTAFKNSIYSIVINKGDYNNK